MANLKLGKLPDRIPVKLAISVSPDLNRALVEYAAAYRETYGQDEAIADLIPAMLSAFLAEDRAFAKRRRSGLDG
jgi:hypothetical protein